MEQESHRKIGVIGLGYVGLPVAVAFGRVYGDVVGFDISERRVKQLRAGVDVTGEVDTDQLRASKLCVTTNPRDLAQCDFFIVTVPTPIDSTNRPDLSALRAASHTVGTVMQAGAIVVYESTVYPGVTEDVCGAVLEDASGLRCGHDFKLAYSPERINPGDREHSFEKITKVVAGQDEETLGIVARTYGDVVQAGVHRAPTIKVAEAAKVIENTQRDLNIALMNELSIIFDKLGIDTLDVLEAAGTKWNFLKFTPGLVGGHCIGVDPYYLTTRAEQAGVHPQVILAGRRINDNMGTFIVERTVKELIAAGRNIHGARVGVVGISFKENVPDIRNSRVPEIVRGLQSYGLEVAVYDPMADPCEVRREYDLGLAEPEQLEGAAAIVYAVPHRDTSTWVEQLCQHTSTAVVVDVRGALSRSRLPSTLRYWRL